MPLDRSPETSTALAAVTAAIVGVIANLALWFALHVLFAEVDTVATGWLRLSVPAPATFQPVLAGLGVLAAILIFVLRRGIVATLAITALAGLGLSLLG